MVPDPIAPWSTSARTTAWLLERLPEEVWTAGVPGVRGRKLCQIAAHLHNNRVRWLKQVDPVDREPPAPVDGRRVSRAELLEALARSALAMRRMFEALRDAGGALPDFPWRNVPFDLEHFVAYHVAHEAHHRGQLVLICRQLGHRLPSSITGGLWQWRHRAPEAEEGRGPAGQAERSC